tara:strand:+ start:3335 stop:3868 length:534 start_codon:yes stop_codon:yes gene_type:complete
MEKLLSLQAELKAPKNQFNAFGKYKYRSCEDILEALKPLLLKHGLVLTISDTIKEVGGITFVESTASITDGESEEFVTAQAGVDVNRKGMDVAQCFGASSSYSRKYALNGLFLIDDTKDPDYTNDHSKKPTVKPTDTLTNERFEKALELIKQGKYTIEKLKAEYKLTELQNKALLTL